MPDFNLNSAITRILTGDKTPKHPMGCGFIVSSKYIFTCAHVVLDALKLEHSTIEKPEQIIFLDFPLLERQPGVNAKVKKWYPIKPSAVMENRRIGRIGDILFFKISR